MANDRVAQDDLGSQWLPVAVCIVLNMLDGFDVLVMAFTASEVSAHWKLTGGQLGALLSAGLSGMAGGSLFVAPFADRYGRRAIILLCLGLITLGMLLSALARQPAQLGALRVLTGVGIGGMLASLSVITAEYSSDKWRQTNVSLQATGYPVGATVGGSIAALLITRFGWRSVFLFGAFASALMVPVVVRWLPESKDFLRARESPQAGARKGVPMAELFTSRHARSTVLIWSGFFLVMFSFYFVLSWTPKLLVAAGLSARQGITGGVLLNLGGIVGGSLFSYLALRRSARWLACIYATVAAASLVSFGLLGSQLGPAFVIALGIGVFLFGSMVGLYALAPSLYPTAIRTTGMGWAIGIGRVGAILAPLTVGLLIDSGWQTPQLYFAFAAPLLAAALVVTGLKPAA
jgi:benzoate transport